MVHYFHQADDPYSHLAIQKLDALKASYRLPFVPHLVSAPAADFQGDDRHYANWAYSDAHSIAGFYGTSLPSSRTQPDRQQVESANRILAASLNGDEFASTAISVGECLWHHKMLDISHTQQNCEGVLAAGDRLRRQLGHYFGAMYYFEGEWFWGVDRLHLLEKRLRQEGFAINPESTPCAAIPQAEDAGGIDASQITLEYFPSLRSPYTAVGHARVVDLVQRTGVNLKLRPVMPMMMRGIPNPQPKQLYIMMDAAREARTQGVPFGHFIDPFGEPVKRAFAFFPAAQRMGKGLEYVSAYLSAAFAEGIDITSDRGMARVAENAGLNWAALQSAGTEDSWEQLLETNLNAMQGAGLWGVPSFRVSDSHNKTAYACWGQDRIWRVETEISRRAKYLAGGETHA